MRIPLPLGVALVTGLLCTGCFASAGPVIGWSPNRGRTLGWEAGGGHAFVHGVVGQSWRPRAEPAGSVRLPAPPTETRDERLTYLALEPWFGVGGTFGLALSSDAPSLGTLLGAWVAYGGPQTISGSTMDEAGLDLLVSVAAGARWMHGAWELYVTPKLGVFGVP